MALSRSQSKLHSNQKHKKSANSSLALHPHHKGSIDFHYKEKLSVQAERSEIFHLKQANPEDTAQMLQVCETTKLLMKTIRREGTTWNGKKRFSKVKKLRLAAVKFTKFRFIVNLCSSKMHLDWRLSAIFSSLSWLQLWSSEHSESCQSELINERTLFAHKTNFICSSNTSQLGKLVMFQQSCAIKGHNSFLLSHIQIRLFHYTCDENLWSKLRHEARFRAKEVAFRR